MTSFSITPNPARSMFTLTNRAASCASLTLRNALGETVRSYALPQSDKAQLDLRGLAPGVYMATLETGARSLTRKLVITAR